jgi:hypothetical protein
MNETAETVLNPAPGLVIRTFLDLSTEHLRRDTYTDLNGYEHIVAHKTTYGWLLFVTDGDITWQADNGDWPSELQPIVELARGLGCSYVLFDEDGPVNEVLPTFDWDAGDAWQLSGGQQPAPDEQSADPPRLVRPGRLGRGERAGSVRYECTFTLPVDGGEADTPRQAAQLAWEWTRETEGPTVEVVHPGGVVDIDLSDDADSLPAGWDDLDQTPLPLTVDPDATGDAALVVAALIGSHRSPGELAAIVAHAGDLMAAEAGPPAQCLATAIRRMTG